MAEWPRIGLRGRSSPEPLPAEGTAANGLPRESVWDYPRPPRLESEPRLVEVILGGEQIARSERALRVCETASPPVVYLPAADVAAGAVHAAEGSSLCEWKGRASYLDASAGGIHVKQAAWTYNSPSPTFEPLTGYLAFYPGRVECRLAGESVEPQPGEFYGGWITAETTGPFKGEPGTGGW